MSRYSSADQYYAASRDGTKLVLAVDGTLWDNSGVPPLNNTNVTRPRQNTTTYIWKKGDRIDALAHKLLGDSTLFWQILDLNLTIHDPTGITPGTVIVVPSA